MLQDGQKEFGAACCTCAERFYTFKTSRLCRPLPTGCHESSGDTEKGQVSCGRRTADEPWLGRHPMPVSSSAFISWFQTNPLDYRMHKVAGFLHDTYDSVQSLTKAACLTQFTRLAHSVACSFQSLSFWSHCSWLPPKRRRGHILKVFSNVSDQNLFSASHGWGASWERIWRCSNGCFDWYQ